MRKQNDPFKVEKIRAELAAQLRFSELFKTYSESYPEIKDFNTSKLWDKLNFQKLISRENNPMMRDRVDTVASLIKGNNIKVLNIGFGSAILEQIIFENLGNFKWYGIDISPRSVRDACKKYSQGIFKIGIITNIKHKPSYFDYVVILEVLEHIRPSQTFKALKEIYRVLKRGGKAIVSVPLNEKLKEMVAKGENPNAHVRTYTHNLIKAELRIAGFKILKEKTLFAFNKNYKIKTIIAKYIFHGIREPNNIIVLAQKP